MTLPEEAPVAVTADAAPPALDETIEVVIKVEEQHDSADSTRTSETTPCSAEAREARSKHKRRSGNSVDLTYRYHEPSDDELSWTEDEHGNRRRRKSRKRTSGGGDDFKNGIV